VEVGLPVEDVVVRAGWLLLLLLLAGRQGTEVDHFHHRCSQRLLQ
jgi:hypothetical protein